MRSHDYPSLGKNTLNRGWSCWDTKNCTKQWPQQLVFFVCRDSRMRLGVILVYSCNVLCQLYCWRYGLLYISRFLLSLLVAPKSREQSFFLCGSFAESVAGVAWSEKTAELVPEVSVDVSSSGAAKDSQIPHLSISFTSSPANINDKNKTRNKNWVTYIYVTSINYSNLQTAFWRPSGLISKQIWTKSTNQHFTKEFELNTTKIVYTGQQNCKPESKL